MAPALLDLPHEVLHAIFSQVNPSDLAQLSCCRTLHTFIKSDRLLPKELYLHHFDDPRKRAAGILGDIEWEQKLHEIVKTEKLLKAGTAELLKDNLEQVATTVLFLLGTAQDKLQVQSGYEFRVSSNLWFLRRHFATALEHPQQQLLSGSSLYLWAANFLWNSTLSNTNQCGTSFLGNDQNAPDSTTDAAAPLIPQVIATAAPQTSHASQLSAKLHCLYGIPIQYLRRRANTSSPTRYTLRSDTSPIHGFARARTYDLAQHTRNSLWGPFKDDGSRSVDWEKVEAIMLDLDYSFRQLTSSRELSERHELLGQSIIPDWSIPFEGAAPYSYVPRPTSIPKEPTLPLEAQDPYAITGTWNRVVCFLDYTEFFDFNFAGRRSQSEPITQPLMIDEAIRLITMKIHITKIEQPGEKDGKGQPVVWFHGISSSVRPSWDPNANSKIRGCVRLTPEGEVHWTTWSIFHGEERWRSEGVQIGGIQSGRGVLGFWFDKDFDEHGPAGPTAFWKVHDGIEKETENDRMHHLHALHIPLY